VQNDHVPTSLSPAEFVRLGVAEKLTTFESLQKGVLESRPEKQVARREPLVGRVVPCLERVEGSFVLQGHGGGQHSTIEPEREKPKPASLRGPACYLAIKQESLVTRGNRRTVSPLPAGRLEPKALCQAAIQPVATVGNLERERTLLAEPPEPTSEPAPKVPTSATPERLPVAVDRDERGTLERSQPRTVATLVGGGPQLT
jgi:hypothetical protein